MFGGRGREGGRDVWLRQLQRFLPCLALIPSSFHLGKWQDEVMAEEPNVSPSALSKNLDSSMLGNWMDVLPSAGVGRERGRGVVESLTRSGHSFSLPSQIELVLISSLGLPKP